MSADATRDERSRPPRNPLLVLPDRTAPCPCGSGSAFGACCDAHLPDREIGQAIKEARRRNDKVAGLVAARADLCQWVIWHRTNTVPRMNAGLVAIGELVRLDILNLTDSAERVAELLELSDRSDEIGAVIERLRGHVDDPRWQRRIAYILALHAWKAKRLDVARAELAKLGPIDEHETDPDILRLHLGLTARTASFGERLRLLDRMLTLSDSREDQLRHRGVKAALYIEHGDPAASVRELEAAIAGVSADDEADLSWDEMLLLVWCLSHVGLLGGHSEAFERAAALVQTELDHPGITPACQGILFKELGDINRFARKPDGAEIAYRRALDFGENHPARIFLAEALILQGRAADARVELRPLESATMDRPEQEDLLFVSATLAIHLADPAALKSASARLRAWRGSAPYFERRRLAFLVAVEDSLKQGAKASLLTKARRLLADPVAIINRYFILEPNVAGVGVNINNFLQDFAEAKDR